MKRRYLYSMTEIVVSGHVSQGGRRDCDLFIHETTLIRNPTHWF